MKRLKRRAVSPAVHAGAMIVKLVVRLVLVLVLVLTAMVALPSVTVLAQMLAATATAVLAAALAVAVSAAVAEMATVCMLLLRKLTTWTVAMLPAEVEVGALAALATLGVSTAVA